ncbi:uncharacterized protein LOC118468499 [Anopheles albimanus]|uniref:uncharacterized protein LOC118468499 n=1 Tax=Anopheles albimanus TaxID=7167 RepID=UPI00163EB09A|nr:uncharacterized protein LOC118468499 [Anopheles albimanus]
MGSGNDSGTGTGAISATTTTALTTPPGTSSSNFTRIRSTTRSTMAKATAVRVSTGKKFSQLLIITPAVAIDSNEHDDYRGPFNSSSLDSGCGGSSEGSLSDDTTDHPNGSNPDRRHRRHRRHSGDREQQGTGDQRNNNAARLLPLLGRQARAGDGPSGMQTRSSGGTAAAGWRWCGLICSAVKCFRAAATATGTATAMSGAKQRGGPFGAGSTIRYTSAGDGTDQQSQQPQQYQYDAVSPFVHTRPSGRHGAKPRFSSDRVYEYTIKSYRPPQRRSRSRSASVSSELSALSTAAGTVATTEATDHDHINNNTGTRGSGSNGNILLSSTLLPGSSAGTIIVTTTTTTSEEEEEEAIGGTAGVHDRKNIMYKL